MTTVLIQGKEYPIHCSVNAIRKFAQLENVTMDEVLNMLDRLTTEQTIRLIYASLSEAARREGNEQMTEQDVWDWIDEDMSVLENCTKALIESMPKSKNLKAPKKGA